MSKIKKLENLFKKNKVLKRIELNEYFKWGSWITALINVMIKKWYDIEIKYDWLNWYPLEYKMKWFRPNFRTVFLLVNKQYPELKEEMIDLFIQKTKFKNE